MIDWQEVERQVGRIAGNAQPARLLNVTLPVSGPTEFALAPDADWTVWRRPREGLSMVGLGRAFEVGSAGDGRFAALAAAHQGLARQWQPTPPMPPLAFVGFAFAPQGGDPLPNASLWVPEVLWREHGDVRCVTFSCAADDAATATARWRRLWEAARGCGADAPAQAYVARHDPLAARALRARGEAAISAIAANRADKLVLTGALHLSSAAPPDPMSVIDRLAEQHPACAIFGVARDGVRFVGASPETLLAAAGAEVTADALAGTAWGQGRLTLDAAKNRSEHDMVARDIAAALAALCEEVAVPAAPESLAVAELLHLRRRITARRPAQTGVFDLVAQLHPTPAVGGAPRTAALDWLQRHGDKRGAWYTGGVGWVDAAGDCDIAVALRCGLLQGGQATLYAGAGLVAGSEIEDELAEMEAKFSAMQTALGTACAPSRRKRAA